MGDSNVKMTSNKERDLFWCLDIKGQLKLLWAWVKRSNSIMKRILRIKMMLKGLKVGLLYYMSVNLMWKWPPIKKDSCSDG